VLSHRSDSESLSFLRLFFNSFAATYTQMDHSTSTFSSWGQYLGTLWIEDSSTTVMVYTVMSGDEERTGIVAPHLVRSEGPPSVLSCNVVDVRCASVKYRRGSRKEVGHSTVLSSLRSRVTITNVTANVECGHRLYVYFKNSIIAGEHVSLAGEAIKYLERTAGEFIRRLVTVTETRVAIFL